MSDLKPNDSFGPLQQRYKSFSHILIVVSTFALGTFYFGYTIAYFSSIDFSTLIKVYGITWDKTTAQGLLTGCVPIGGGIGALGSKILMKKFSRRQYVFVVNGFALLFGMLVFIQNPYVLLLVRLLQGICVGLYSAITPVIIKQFSPNEISGTLGAVNQFFVSFGVLFAFSFKFILQKIADDESGESYWYIVFGFSLITIMLQSLLLKFAFPYQTPKYLLQNNRQGQARQLIKQFYQQQFVQQVLQEKYLDIGRVGDMGQQNNQQTSTSIVTSQGDLRETEEAESLLQNNRKDTPIAVTMALHLALLQQFVGINAVVAYGGEIAQSAIPSLKSTFPILINLEQVVACFIVSYLLSRVGRKTILQFGTAVGAVSNGIIATGFFIHDSNTTLGNVFILSGLVIYMANFGVSLGPVVWLYIPQIVQPKIVPFSTGLNWAGAALVMLLFPILKQALPNQNPATLFLFFSAWCVVSFLVNAKYIIQTKGKTEKQICQQYKQMPFLF